MNKRMANIEVLYTNLEYEDVDKIVESLEQIHNLTLELSFMKTDSFAQRFLTTASIMKKNLNLFMTACEHVDSALGILNYLNFISMNFKLIHHEADDISEIVNILITIYYIYQEYGIQEFLEKIIVEEELDWYYEYKYALLTYLQVEIILLEDSDLHAVINYLKFKRCVSCLKKIWVHKSIIHIFMWHFEKNVGHLNVPIQIFQSKQELLTSSISENILDKNITVNVISVWSEDVIAATNLARSLNKNIVFINTHMDAFPNIVLPIRGIFHKPIASFDLPMIDKCENSLINPIAHEDLTYDLFYDGMWQKPKKNTYWIHKNILFANATSQDIKECIKSATRGFKNLSTMSIDSRIHMLSKFATILECHGRFSLSEVVSKWIDMSYIYGKMSCNTRTEKFELIIISEPMNTVILREENEITLFQQLTQNLIIGNSVIVICNPDLCILAPYCNMFKMCGIPPGVINLLSTKNANNIKCDDIGNVENVLVAQTKLTIMHYILIHCK